MVYVNDYCLLTFVSAFIFVGSFVLHIYSASTSIRKKGRGPAKGLKLAKRAHESRDGKLDIEFSNMSDSAVGPNQRMFVDEVVQQMRIYAPLNVKKWADVPQEAKDNIVSAVLVIRIKILFILFICDFSYFYLISVSKMFTCIFSVQVENPGHTLAKSQYIKVSKSEIPGLASKTIQGL